MEERRQLPAQPPRCSKASLGTTNTPVCAVTASNPKLSHLARVITLVSCCPNTDLRAIKRSSLLYGGGDPYFPILLMFQWENSNIRDLMVNRKENETPGGQMITGSAAFHFLLSTCSGSADDAEVGLPRAEGKNTALNGFTYVFSITQF